MSDQALGGAPPDLVKQESIEAADITAALYFGSGDCARVVDIRPYFRFRARSSCPGSRCSLTNGSEIRKTERFELAAL